MTLRWLAGGSYLDVAQHYGVSSTTFYDLVNAGCYAIVETFPIVFDMSERSLKQRAKEFGQRQWKHMRVFTGIMGCLDGILLKIKCPSMAEEVTHSSWVASLNADGKYHFLAPSLWDSTEFLLMAVSSSHQMLL